MTTQEIRSLGLKITIPGVPSTYEEFDTMAKKPLAALKAAISNEAYRGWLPMFRDLFLHGQKAEAATDGKPAVPEVKGVEDITGIPRNTTPVLGKDKKPVIKDGEPVVKFSETEDDYFDRVAATLVSEGKFNDEDAAKASFQSLADEVAALIPFDPSVSERKPSGPKKLAAKYKIAAAKAITNGTTDRLNTNMFVNIKKTYTATSDTSKMFTGTFPQKGADNKVTEVSFNVSDKDAEALGWLIKEYQDWKASQELASLTE
jgi:hypothetical protein